MGFTSIPWADNEMALSASTLALLGVVYCFLGYRLIKVILGTTGFLLAAGPAALLGAYLSHGNSLAGMVGLAVGGLCGAVALLFLYQLGVFALGSLGAGLVAHYALSLAPQPWTPWAVAGLALLGGFMTLWLERPIVCFAASAIGAWLLSSAALMALTEAAVRMELEDIDPASPQVRMAALGLWALLTVLGLLTQRPFAKKRPAAE